MYYSVSDKHSSNLLVLIRITLVLEPLHVEFYNLRLEALHVVREIDDLSIFITNIFVTLSVMMLLFTPTADTYILILSRTHLYYRRYPDFLQYYFNRAYQ